MTATIEYKGQELGVEYNKNGKLYAGFISNAGISHDWEMQYEQDFTWEQNLALMYDLITETWNYDD